MTETQSQVVKWLATGSIGASSKCMAMWLGFGELTPGAASDYPYDPDDLDRCLMLLDKAPGLRPLIPKMAEISPAWARLSERWEEIERSHLDEVGLRWTKAKSAPQTYKLMQSVIRPPGLTVRSSGPTTAWLGCSIFVLSCGPLRSA